MTFAPFAVQCQTCGSRFRVTNPALVGTIASCPKCNSMVEIAAPTPEGQLAVGDSNVDSQALTEDSINVDTDSVDPSQMPSGFAGREAAPPEPSEEAASSPVPPDWQSEKTQKSRQIGMIVAVSATSILAAVLLFGWFVRTFRDQRQANADTDQPQVADTDSLNSPPDQPNEPESDTVQSTDVDTDSQGSPTDPSHDTGDTNPKTTDNAPSPGTGPNSTPEPQPPATDGSDDITSVVDPPSDLIPASPLEDLLNPNAGDSKPEDDELPSLESLPPGLRDMAVTLDLDTKPAQPTLKAPKVDITPDGPAKQNIDPMLIANPPKEIEPKRQLGAVKFAMSAREGKYPLADLTLVVSQLTGAPIQIDWVSFDLMNRDLRQKVNVPRKVVTAGEFLEQVAVAVDGEIKIGELMITLTPSAESRKAAFDRIFDLSDFADPDSAALVINEFLSGADAALSNKLSIGEEPQEQELAALGVEALRRMRGVTAKVGETGFRRWAQPASEPSEGWPVITDGVGTKQLDAPVTMAGLLRRTSKANGASCFINWYDGVLQKLAPDQLTMPRAGEAGDVLKSSLDPFKLQVRQVDAQFWWVGAEATYDRFPVIVWTEPLGPDPYDRLQELLGIVMKSEPQVNNAVVDKETGRALLVLPRYIVQQLPKIQGALAQVKSPAP